MTVKKLKEILEKYDDNDRVIMDCGDIAYANAANEFVATLENKGVVLLLTRADINAQREIENFLNKCSEENWDEVDALTELSEYGYKLSDLAYDPNRFTWAKEIAKTHGIWPDLVFTSPKDMINYVWNNYMEGDEEFSGAYFDFDVKMKKSDIVKSYAWLQVKINSDDVYQTDGNGKRLNFFDVSDEVYEGNCEKFLRELGESGFFVRKTEENEEPVDFIF